jgi:hypothetical protein
MNVYGMLYTIKSNYINKRKIQTVNQPTSNIPTISEATSGSKQSSIRDTKNNI